MGPSDLRQQDLVGSNILVIEDDASLRESLALLLESVGFSVTAEGDGGSGLQRFRSQKFDLLVLDLMLPGRGGLDVCREVRSISPVPILILTARTDLPTLVSGLECGGDDYVTKPFEAAELVARLRALLRRAGRNNHETERTVGDLQIDTAGFRLHKRGQPIQLSATEFRLLTEMAEHAGRVRTRESLLQAVWGYDYLGDSRLVDMAIKRLRDRLEDDPRRPRYIATVRGVGYRFDGVGS